MMVYHTPSMRNKAILLAFAMLATSFTVFGQERTARTDSGSVQGVAGSDSQVSVYLGIPYAAPPVGELRWRAPQPVATWKGVRAANHFSASCMQHIAGERLPWTKPFMAQLPVSEDCLYLNVWTSGGKSKELKPVLFWIHGGGFTEGAASPTIFSGENLAKSGIVVVSINYRLGMMGFFALPELTSESEHHASGNYGMLDMVAALEWTRKNIRAFGGDPDKVTIDGQSAGASAVQFLTASPLAKGLFRGAIIESGAYLLEGQPNKLEDEEKMGTAVESAAKKFSLKELRALPATDAMLAGSHAHMKFTPDIDGWFLPESVPQIFADRKQNDVPTIDGMVADEGSSHDGYGKETPEAYKKRVRDSYGTLAEDFLRLYPAETQAECTESQKGLERDRRLASMYLWGVKRSETGKTAAYTYYFSHVLPWPDHPEFAAFHSSEIPYWTRNYRILDRPFTAKDAETSEVLSNYWLNFVKTGSPNGKGVPAWPVVKAGTPETMDLGDPIRVRPIMSEEKLNLWLKRDKAEGWWAGK
jgi:para-nitrobenzyl esterase